MKTILSWLLHHANRDFHYSYKSDFYKIKNHILSKYGEFKGFDLQIIEGKKCFACNGTGIYTGYYWDSGEEWQDTCDRCYGGWYKRPQYVILDKIKFGKYSFHKPRNITYYTKKEIPKFETVNKIIGYINHEQSIYSEFASKVLFLIYDRETFKLKYIRSMGVAWYCSWWLPRNYINNAIWLIRQIKKEKIKEMELPF